VEGALLLFEKTLPSTGIKQLAVTREMIESPEKTLNMLIDNPEDQGLRRTFEELSAQERQRIVDYITDNSDTFSEKSGLQLTASRIALAAEVYCSQVSDIEKVLKRIKAFYEETKTIELYFIKNHGINIVLEEEAIDYILERCFASGSTPEGYYRNLTADFEHGLKLVRQKTGRTRFFITREALEKPDSYIADLLAPIEKKHPQLPLNPDNLLEGDTPK
jgi:hypothetical protein